MVKARETLCRVTIRKAESAVPLSTKKPRQMVIISVSNKSENPMLRTVRILRRLLRKEFLRTKLVRVITVLRLQKGTRERSAAIAIKNRRLPAARQGDAAVHFLLLIRECSPAVADCAR